MGSPLPLTGGGIGAGGGVPSGVFSGGLTAMYANPAKGDPGGDDEAEDDADGSRAGNGDRRRRMPGESAAKKAGKLSSLCGDDGCNYVCMCVCMHVCICVCVNIYRNPKVSETEQFSINM